MTTGPKRKRVSHSRLESWWREFVFTRAFDIETYLPPEECAERLRNLEYEFPKRTGRLCKVNTATAPITFEVHLRRSYVLGWTTSAKASGTISVDPLVKLTTVAVETSVAPEWFAFFVFLALVSACILVIPCQGDCHQWPIQQLGLLFSIVMCLLGLLQQFLDRKPPIRALASALDDGTLDYRAKVRWIWLS